MSGDVSKCSNDLQNLKIGHQYNWENDKRVESETMIRGHYKQTDITNKSDITNRIEF